MALVAPLFSSMKYYCEDTHGRPTTRTKAFRVSVWRGGEKRKVRKKEKAQTPEVTRINGASFCV